MKIWTNKNKVRYGRIKCIEGRILVEFDSSETVGDNEKPTYYEETNKVLLDRQGNPSVSTMTKPIRIRIDPIVQQIRPYSLLVPANYHENIHPQSSPSDSDVGWYGRMLLGQDTYRYTVHEIFNDNRLWLKIADFSGNIVQKHIIQGYEIMPFVIPTNWEKNKDYLEAMGPSSPSIIRENVLSVLDGPSLSWKEIATLSEGLSVKIIERGQRARDVLEVLVPSEFSGNIREEIMLFLFWTVRNPISKEDPIDFFDNLVPLGVAPRLLMGHLQCILEGEKPPSYLKLMYLAINKKARSTAAVDETSEPLSHIPFWTRVVGMYRAWRPRVIDYARRMNQSDEIYVQFPVTRTKARQSRNAWKERLAMHSLGFNVRGHTWPQTMGLKQILYFGASHRWNHPHLAFSVRLGDISENPPHLQVMTLPPPSVEEIVSRGIFANAKLNSSGTLIRGQIEVGWSNRTVNYNLFDETKDSWKVPLDKIETSPWNTVSLRKLVKRYGGGKGHYVPTSKEAKVIDMVGSSLYLSDFEQSRGEEYWEVSAKEVRDILDKLKNRGVLKLSYELANIRLASVATLIQGPPSSLYSLTKALLDYTPTSLAMTSDTGEFALVISRVPMNVRQNLRDTLLSAGENSDLIVKTMIPAAFRSYTWNLYQRLLTPEGTWNDDISIFRDQILSRQSFRRTDD